MKPIGQIYLLSQGEYSDYNVICVSNSRYRIIKEMIRQAKSIASYYTVDNEIKTKKLNIQYYNEHNANAYQIDKAQHETEVYYKINRNWKNHIIQYNIEIIDLI